VKEKTVKRVCSLYVFIFILWGFYRFLFLFPEEVEELFFKPLVWLLPTFYLVLKDKEGLSSLGFSSKNLLKSIFLGLLLGIFFVFEGLLAYFLKSYSFSFIKFDLSFKVFAFSLFLSLATAFSEETVFRGYIFSRLCRILNSKWQANFVSSLGWSLVHLPITIFVFHFTFLEVIAFLVLTFVFGLAASFVFSKTQNLVGPLILHVLWALPNTLFA